MPLFGLSNGRRFLVRTLTIEVSAAPGTRDSRMAFELLAGAREIRSLNSRGTSSFGRRLR